MFRLRIFAFCIILMGLFFISASGQDEVRGAFPERRKGGSNPEVTVEVFIDLQCPSCATFFTSELLTGIERRFGQRVAVIYRNWPLMQIHRDAFLAACAVEAAGLQGKFWEMIQVLLGRQSEWVRRRNLRKRDVLPMSMLDPKPEYNAMVVERFVLYAKDLGLDADMFRDDLKGNFVKNRVTADVRRATELRIYSTPTVIVNGEILSFEDHQNLTDFIERKLKKQR